MKLGVFPGLSGIWKCPTKVPNTALTLLVASRTSSKKPKPCPCCVSSWMAPPGVAGEMPMLFRR
jgi:hypothetical protein